MISSIRDRGPELQVPDGGSLPAGVGAGASPHSRPHATLSGFEHRFATVHGVRLHYVSGGKAAGKFVVLLAGFPESWYAWRKVMLLLAATYRVVAMDMPGQGDSDRPASGFDTQSFAVAVHNLLQQIGIKQYFLSAHDVGAWVAYPYAMLFGDEVERMALFDAGIPGVTLPDALPIDPERAWRTLHFAFHAIPDLPEVLITGREREYLDWFLRRKTANLEVFADEGIGECLRVFSKDGGLRAGLAYYRAAALSAEQNCTLSAKGKLQVPLLALSADQGSIGDMDSPLRSVAPHVVGSTIAFCGHFLPEEQPEAVAEELGRLFSEV